MSDVQEELDNQIQAAMQAIEAKQVTREDTTDVGDSITDSSSPKDDITEKALKMGWNPKGSKDAKRFVEDKSFFDRIESKNKKIDELADTVRNLVDHNSKLEKASYEKALRDLQRAKEDAVSTADVARYRAIETEQIQVQKQIQEVELQAETIRPKQDAPQISEELLQFKEDNKAWFNLDTEENKDMVEDADYIDKRIAKQAAREGRVLTQAEHLKLVTDAIKKQYPHRFKNTKRDEVGTVGSSTTERESGKSISSKLTSQQKNFVKQARAYGSKMTEESYAKQLKLTGELRDE